MKRLALKERLALKAGLTLTMVFSVLLFFFPSPLRSSSLVRIYYGQKSACLKKVLSSGFRTIVHRPSLYIDVVVPENKQRWLSQFKDTQILHSGFDHYIKAISASENYDSYHTKEEIKTRLSQWEAQYPDIVNTSIIGYGWDKSGKALQNPIRMITLGNHEQKKPALLLFAGIHSREISSTEVLLRICSRLLETGNDMLSKLSIFIIPCLNPGGRELIFDGHIWWRKNCRAGQYGTVTGVDINRNFPFKFGVNSPYGGSSNLETAETFRGLHPASEPESQAVIDLIVKHPEIIGSISVHSYGGFVLVPNGFNGKWPLKHKVLYKEVTDYITAGGDWTVGTVREILGYYSNGRHDDWLYGAVSKKKKQVLALQLEIGNSFFPECHKLKPLTDQVYPLVTRFAEKITALPEIKLTPLSGFDITGLSSTSSNLFFTLTIKNRQFGEIKNLRGHISVNNRIIRQIGCKKLAGSLRNTEDNCVNDSFKVEFSVNKAIVESAKSCKISIFWNEGKVTVSRLFFQS